MGRWDGSDRSERLPKDWPKNRIIVLESAGYRCQALDNWAERCIRKATEVDHIQQSKADDHSLSNLQALCWPCHNRKTHAEGRKAKEARNRW